MSYQWNPERETSPVHISPVLLWSFPSWFFSVLLIRAACSLCVLSSWTASIVLTQPTHRHQKPELIQSSVFNCTPLTNMFHEHMQLLLHINKRFNSCTDRMHTGHHVTAVSAPLPTCDFECLGHKDSRTLIHSMSVTSHRHTSLWRKTYHRSQWFLC